MENLIRKIFSKSGKNKPQIGRTFSPDAIKPVFKQYGFDIDDNIGENKFPFIDYRNHESKQMAYDVQFNDIAIIPVTINGEMSTIITGKYMAQAVESGFRNQFGNPQRGEPVHYDFKIQEGKLNLKERN